MNENSYIEAKLFFLMCLRWTLLIGCGVFVFVALCLFVYPTLWRLSSTPNGEARYHRARIDTLRVLNEARREFVNARITNRREIMEAYLDECQNRVTNHQLAFTKAKCLDGIFSTD